ncbi:class C beta-lactamase-related serine hydrolase [Aquibium carbonis]|uniref:Class C beta-lactamase-related serine hydrolase n=1 Tax=Aquibium carbonis TaxID=2495581 RepID=A0A3R9YCC1_9HYPH|nr:serine hydrolase [Aquibium carbonis]RST84452.1 class C beta-lactamase-related serine hydrolase [Aquibium carbonis]
MRILGFIVKWLVILVVVAVAGLAGWLYLAPPDLIRVASGYTAKMVCSNVFVAGRDSREVLAIDVQAPGHPILGYLSVDVDPSAGTARAALLGLFGPGLAVDRAGLGCASVPSGDRASLADLSATPGSNAVRRGPWPSGDMVEPTQAEGIRAILENEALVGPGMRAVVVVKDGRIVGERYGEGFDASSPSLGWSMTKTVNAVIVGTLVAEGQLSLDQAGLFPGWSDGRARITVADLMGMQSGLVFNEDYGDVTDVTRMLYLEPDMAGFAASKPLAGPPGTIFNYSSGTAVLLSRLWQDTLGEPQAAMDWPREALFDPLGMESAVLETDAAGTFVGSSYLYATARDWARFGLFMLGDGSIGGRRLVPAGFLEWMRQPASASNGDYGNGQLWLHGPEAGTPEGQHPDAGFDLPEDAVWALGHDGQSMAMIPSRGIVVLRMGLTPSKLGWKSQGLVEAVVSALE